MVFTNHAAFTGNRSDELEFGIGPGGALANHVKGTIRFRGNINIVDNDADVSGIEASCAKIGLPLPPQKVHSYTAGDAVLSVGCHNN